MNTQNTEAENPLLADWNEPFGVPPFGRIRPEHFRPAFAHAFAEHAAEVAAIAAEPAAPSFANTIEALERSGEALTRVDNVFDALAGAHTNDAILEIEREIAPLDARHWNKILMDAALFGRIEALHRDRDRLALTAEQRRVLERYHVMFTRAGAALDAGSKARLAAINERLATLGTAFGQNVLADEQSYALVLDGEADLAGLPDFVRAAARQAAEERGMAGKHVVTLSRSSVEPFLEFSARRDLREKAVPRLDRARRGRRRNRQQGDHRRDGGAAGRARAGCSAIRLRPLPARRRHGEDAGGGARAARAGLGAGARRARWRTATPCRRSRRRRAAISSSRHGTGATTPASCARRAATSTRRRSSRISSSTASSRRPSTRRAGCSA